MRRRRKLPLRLLDFARESCGTTLLLAACIALSFWEVVILGGKPARRKEGRAA